MHDLFDIGNRTASAQDDSLHAHWHPDGRVTIRNRAWQIVHECKALTGREFDNVCQEWGIEVRAKR